MTAKSNSSSSGSKSKQSTSDGSTQPLLEEPVPSYETALREGAGGHSAGPSSSNTAAQPTALNRPSYGCSPYTPNGTTRIVIVPAPHFHHLQQHAHMHIGQAQDQTHLPTPVSMQASPVRRAAPRFFLALVQGMIIYLLINLLVDLTVTRKW